MSLSNTREFSALLVEIAPIILLHFIIIYAPHDAIVKHHFRLTIENTGQPDTSDELLSDDEIDSFCILHMIMDAIHDPKTPDPTNPAVATLIV